MEPPILLGCPGDSVETHTIEWSPKTPDDTIVASQEILSQIVELVRAEDNSGSVPSVTAYLDGESGRTTINELTEFQLEVPTAVMLDFADPAGNHANCSGQS